MFLQNWESNSKFQMNLCFWESLSIFQDFTMQWNTQCSKNSTWVTLCTADLWHGANSEFWLLLWLRANVLLLLLEFCRLVWNVLTILECSAHQFCTQPGIFSIILLRSIYKYFIILFHNINQIIYYKNTQIFEIIFRGL